MKLKLSDKKLQSLKTEERRMDCWDSITPGFFVRISPSGRKIFYAAYRAHGKQRRQKIGEYPYTKLADARKNALEQILTAKKNPYVRLDITVRDAMEKFREQYLEVNNKDWKGAYARLMIFAESYGSRDIRSITRREMISLLDQLIERGARTQANRVLAHVHKFYNWCVERDYIDNNPISGIRKPSKEVPRSRCLNDYEIKCVWDVANKMGYPFGNIIHLLILTGQRKSEVSGMCWSELDLDNKRWTIPAIRAKNGHKHTVPLSESAVKILLNTPRVSGSDYVFTTTVTTPVSGFGRMKDSLDKNSMVNEWRLHDLRRTFASNLAKLSVPIQVVEKILNHKSGVISGIAAVYNVYDYQKEMREAVEAWELRLGEILNGNCKN